MHFSAKTISESVPVQLEVDGLRLKYPRFDDFWLGLTWRLARSSSIMGISDGKYKLFKSHGMLTQKGTVVIPSITLLFIDMDNEVEILAIRPSIPEANIEEIDI